MRYLVKARVKPDQAKPLLAAIESGELGRGSIAGEEYAHNMNEARVDERGVAHWVETCFCANAPPGGTSLLGKIFRPAFGQRRARSKELPA